MNNIGTLNEGPLHAALKAWYARSGDRLEVPLEGYVVDIVRGEQLIEIQTGSFAALKAKLRALTSGHAVTLVYPVAQEKWLLKRAADGREFGRRKSPRRGSALDLFNELVSIPRLVAAPGFTLEVALIREEEVRVHDPRRAWRRQGWVTAERRLLEVLAVRRFAGASELAALLPDTLPETFTTGDIAGALACPRRLAGKMAYCLHQMGALEQIGRRGRAYLYRKDEGGGMEAEGVA